MRTLLIAAPWVVASYAAAYTIVQWGRLPGRMAVTFYLGRASGWQAKTTAIPVILLLMFGILAVFTVLLSMPDKIRLRGGPLSDPVGDRRLALRILFVGYILIGAWMPLSVIHLVNRNL